MTIQRLSPGKYTAFCWRCHYGVIQRRALVFDWAIQHQVLHQKAAAQ